MEILETLGINWGMLIAQIINFALLMTALTYFLYKPALRVIDERRERIRESMDNAAKLEQRVHDLEKDRKKRLKEIDAEALSLLEQARQQAESMKKEILDAARAEADTVLEKGRKQLDNERKKLLSDMQNTVIAASIQLSERILAREFSESDQKKMLQSLEQDVSNALTSASA
jgi:F-type H+-transporting ATPase subunit b